MAEPVYKLVLQINNGGRYCKMFQKEENVASTETTQRTVTGKNGSRKMNG